MFHGAAWTHVKLVDVLADIKTFLDQSTGEIVIATLLIDDKTDGRSSSGSGRASRWRDT